MFETQGAKSRSVLISGASIAGPALAYWLDRYGFDVTVVERAPALCSGGYPIEVRGTAIGVVERMGLLPRAQAEHIDSRELRFVDAEGRTIGTIPPYDLTNNQADRDVELPRGALTKVLYDLTEERPIRYRFNDSIETLKDDGSGVEIQFRSGDRCRYDVVIGADGLHSRTRRLVFGPEDQFNHYLGNCFSIFSMPDYLGLSHGPIIYGEAGRSAGVFAVPNSKDVFAFLNFVTDAPPCGALGGTVPAHCGRVRRCRLGSAAPAGGNAARKGSLFRHGEPDPHACLVLGAGGLGRRCGVCAFVPVRTGYEPCACRRLCPRRRAGVAGRSFRGICDL
jgi:hypothetical protein